MKKKVLTGLAVVAVVLVVAAAVFAGVVAMKPNEFKIERSATISAPAADVFAQVNDFHNWKVWSPWEKLDPDMKRTIDGPTSGKGAKYSWVGNDKAGEGMMTITDSRPGESISIELEFVRPMQDASDVEFRFQPDGKKTVVTWTMTGEHKNFAGKAFCTVINLDKLIGTDFEKGLEGIRRIVEMPQP